MTQRAEFRPNFGLCLCAPANKPREIASAGAGRLNDSTSPCDLIQGAVNVRDQILARCMSEFTQGVI